MKEVVTVREIVHALLERGWLIVGAAIVCMSVAAVLASLVPAKYEASVLVAPVSSEGSGASRGLSSIISRVGGLASLAGLSGDTDSLKVEAIAVLKSFELTSEYIRAGDLLPILYADRWNAAARTWKAGFMQKEPTVWQAHRRFNKSIRFVTEDAETGLLTVTIRWTDPVLAATWANDFVRITNAKMKQKAIEEAGRNITFLKSQAQQTNVVQLQNTLYSMLEDEIRKEMLASGSEEYAFRVIDPAIVPESRSSPSPVLWAIFGLVVGAGGAMLLVLGSLGWKRA